MLGRLWDEIRRTDLKDPVAALAMLLIAFGLLGLVLLHV